ncbi:hypothetical protein L596_015924 [Steinernema carpocapsae]|uniref:F-box domain-containing protein n=1 Tax=Steinernema carpocapsae TaxID=34508 RepID=A0A4U5NH90_STECR|nr:hypothetical protein L596_015924 [Steinernema carpocapsae]
MDGLPLIFIECVIKQFPAYAIFDIFKNLDSSNWNNTSLNLTSNETLSKNAYIVDISVYKRGQNWYYFLKEQNYSEDGEESIDTYASFTRYPNFSAEKLHLRDPERRGHKISFNNLMTKVVYPLGPRMIVFLSDRNSQEYINELLSFMISEPFHFIQIHFADGFDNIWECFEPRISQFLAIQLKSNCLQDIFQSFDSNIHVKYNALICEWLLQKQCYNFQCEEFLVKLEFVIERIEKWREDLSQFRIVLGTTEEERQRIETYFGPTTQFREEREGIELSLYFSYSSLFLMSREVQDDKDN